MSRIDDAHSAEKRAEDTRLAEQRSKELVQKKRTEEMTAFDRALVARSQKSVAQQMESKAASASSRSMEEGARPAQKEGDAFRSALFGRRAQGEGAAAARQGAPKQPERAADRDASEASRPSDPPADAKETRAQRAAQGRASLLGKPDGEGERAQGKAEKGRLLLDQGKANLDKSDGRLQRGAENQVASQSLAEARSGLMGTSRQSDARAETRRNAEARGGEVRRDSEQLTRLGEHKRVEGAGRSESDAGGNSKGDKENDASSFKLPLSAFLAPPPVARPRDVEAARFHAINREIVDKIVSRVLVGTNVEGIPEFRIDLKSNVLKGLSIKVSGGRDGRIRAVFSGGDREVIAALRKNADELAEALRSRGLKLEELVFEQA